MPDPSHRRSLSRRKRRACLRNLRKAWTAARARPKTEKQRAAARDNLRRAREAKHFRMTRKRLRASRANVKKAQEAAHARYRFTPAQEAASCANLRKAQAVPRTPESYARSRFNRLKHGLRVRTLEETMRQLGEDPREYEAHQKRFARVLAPANPAEEKIVERIAAAAWQQLRLFKAQARWQSDRLKREFDCARAAPPLDAEATRYRALSLLTLLTDRRKFLRHDQGLTAGVERALRLLLRLRSGGDPDFHLYANRTEREIEESRQLQREIAEQERRIAETQRDLRFWERLYGGGPEVEAALAKVMPAGRKNK